MTEIPIDGDDAPSRDETNPPPDMPYTPPPDPSAGLGEEEQDDGNTT